MVDGRLVEVEDMNFWFPCFREVTYDVMGTGR